jgi:hypothetical protein
MVHEASFSWKQQLFARLHDCWWNGITMGWQTVPITLCALSCTLFVALLALLVVSSTRGSLRGSTLLYEGNCASATHVNTALHVEEVFSDWNQFLAERAGDTALAAMVLGALDRQLGAASDALQFGGVHHRDVDKLSAD